MILTMLFALQSATNVYASATNSAEFVRSCRETRETAEGVEANYCTGYILGAFDQLSLNHHVCPSPGVRNSQIIAVARKYVIDHPEMWDRPPMVLLRQAFGTAFGCNPEIARRPAH